MANRKWSDEEIIEAAQLYADKHGRPPAARDWRGSGLDHPSINAVDQFGGFKRLRVRAGLTAMTRKWPRDEMISWARDRHALGGVVNYAATAQRERPPHLPDAPVYADIRQEFGDLEALRVAAGIDAGPSLEDLRAQAMEALHDYYHAHGRVPTSTEWRYLSGDEASWYPTEAQICKLLGSWRSFLEEGGYKTDRKGPAPLRARRWGQKEDLIEALRLFGEKHGRAPTTKDFTAATASAPCYQTYRTVFRVDAAATGETAWDYALRLAGFIAPPKHSIARPRAFKKLDDPATCYWFGFFIADGCLDSDGNRVRFKQSTYRGQSEAVYEFRAWVGATHTPSHYTDSSLHQGSNSDRVSLDFVCKEMVADLEAHGARKSKTGTQAGFPDTIDTAAALMGFFDGDGHIEADRGLVRFILPKECVPTLITLLDRLVPGCIYRTYRTKSDYQDFVDVTGASRAQLLRVMCGSVQGHVRTVRHKREAAELLVARIEGGSRPDFG